MQSIEPAKSSGNKALLLTKKISFFVLFIALGILGTFMLETLRAAASVYIVAYPVAAVWNFFGHSQVVGIVAINLFSIIFVSLFSLINYFFILKTSAIARAWQLNGARALAIGGSLPLLCFFSLMAWTAGFKLLIAYLLISPLLCICSQWFAVYKIKQGVSATQTTIASTSGMIEKGNLSALESHLEQIGNAASASEMDLIARSSLQSYGLKISPEQDKDMVPVLLDVLIKHKRFEAADIISRKHLELHENF